MAGRQVIFVLLAAVCVRAGLTASVLSQAAGNVSEKELSCGEGERLFGDSCYYVSDEMEYNWLDANDLCKTLDMSLASIHSQEEQDFIWGWAKDSTWLGLNDISAEGQYEWTDDTPVDFTRWYADQPNDGEAGDCVFMENVSEGEWYDFDCGTKVKAACRRPAV